MQPRVCEVIELDLETMTAWIRPGHQDVQDALENMLLEEDHCPTCALTYQMAKRQGMLEGDRE